eukprot:TRINITY_DN19621_c0_g1_i1.p1 TRINITY_DN19621_c0_g1~~TRINITY_DN19621_c0_g1_i1.p1  ORF type:complete len:336 (-),score=112.07 TRINITY_DN19621_c0_g1_i1:389-1396(-)
MCIRDSASLSQWGAALQLVQPRAEHSGSLDSGSTNGMCSELYAVEPLTRGSPALPASPEPHVLLVGGAGFLWAGGAALFWCVLNSTLAAHCDVEECSRPLRLWRIALAIAAAQLLVAVLASCLDLWSYWRMRGASLGLALLSIGATVVASRPGVSQPWTMALLAGLSAPCGLVCVMCAQAEARGVSTLRAQLVLAGLACAGAAASVLLTQLLDLDRLGVGLASCSMQLLGAAATQLWPSSRPSAQAEESAAAGECSSCGCVMMLMGSWVPWLSLLALPLHPHTGCHAIIPQTDCRYTATLVFGAAAVLLLSAAAGSQCVHTRLVLLLVCTLGSVM